MSDVSDTHPISRSSDEARVLRRTAACRSLLNLDGIATALLGSKVMARGHWSTLLELYLAELEGRRTFQSSLTSDGSTSNVHRRLAALARLGVVRRTPDPYDNRRVDVRLAPPTRAALDQLVDAISPSDGSQADLAPSPLHFDTAAAISVAAGKLEVQRTTVESGGRITLSPAHMRALGIRHGERILLAVENDAIVLRTARSALRRVQGRLRAYATDDEPVSEQLIRERRSEEAE